MPSDRLQLKPGVDPEAALSDLKSLITHTQNVTPSAVGGDSVIALREDFINWVERVEQQLPYLTHDPEILTSLQTPRARMIRELNPASPRPWPLIDAEVQFQANRLQVMADDLKARTARSRSAPGHITVLDTNVLLEYQPPAETPWTKIVQRDSVRLILPLRVVEELDAKKYSQRKGLSNRARRLLPQLAKVIGSSGEPGELRPGVTIEVTVDPGPRLRPEDADEEVLATCTELRQLSGTEITLITADTAMRLRAGALQIPVIEMPGQYLRQPSTGEEA
jgi:hypothetical protein